MNQFLKFFSFCILLNFLFSASAFGQQPATDTVRVVEILQATRKLELLKINDTTQLQVLAGNVKLRQGNTIFTCDSCVINNGAKIFEAFGKVHINDGDTAHIYSDYLRYLIDKRLAYFKKNVRLTDGKGTLTTSVLEYDVNTKLGIYHKGGRVVNEKTVLTSEEGYYYSDLRDIYFKKGVVLKDPAYTLHTDSLLYNTESQVARFISETLIKDSSGRTIKTKEGYYDTKNRKAEFGSRPEIRDSKTTVIANRVTFDDSSGISIAEGNAIIVDTAQGTTIIAGRIMRDDKTESMLAVNKPLMIIKQEEDSIYITADTLFSARLSYLYGKKDSLTKDTIKGTKVIHTKKKDSTDRYFEAFYHVRIFSDSLQSVCDSLFYSLKDSVFRLFKDPVVWSRKSQITGDTILLYTKNKKADRIKVFDNSLLVNKVQGEFFNQIKSARMDGYFTEGAIDLVRARGFAESIYYIQDEDSAFTGVNQSTADIMDIYFKNKELSKVVFRSDVKGTLWPIRSKTAEEMRVTNFKWLEARRPKTKYELFE
ncbi:MAG: OstA family protein [Chitinophagaceae bacterium]